MRRILLVLIPALALAGCATLINRTYQQVTLQTPGVIGADCMIVTPETNYRVITPGSLQIERTNDALEITCHKVAYHDAHLAVKPHMRGAILLNVFNGMGGVPYDVASNADYTYPHIITIPMEVDLDALANARTIDEPAAAPPERKADPGDEVTDDDKTEVDTKPAEKSVNKSLRK